MQERRGEPGAARAERMADRKRPAADVHPRRIEAQFVDAVDRLGGEGLAHLDDVEICERDTASCHPGQELPRGDDRPRAHRCRRHARHRRRHDAGERLESLPPGLCLRHQEHRGGPIAHRRTRRRSHRAELRQEHRLERRHRLEARVAADRLVGHHLDDRPRVVVAEHPHDLVVEEPGVGGPGGLRVALQGILLLPPAGDAVGRGEVFRREPHREHAAARTGQHAGMNIDRRLHRQVLHVLHAAGHLHVLGAGRDRMGRAGDRLERGATEPIDRRAGSGQRQTRHQGRAPGHVAAKFAPLLRSAEDHVFDRGRIDTASLDHALHDGRGQFVAADVPEQAAVGMRPADRRAAAGDDDRRGVWIAKQCHAGESRVGVRP